MSDRFLSEAEVREMTKLGRTTRWELEQRGGFPRRRRIATNRCAWLESEILEWMRSRMLGGPPAPAAALKARGVSSPD
jgi:prophage regulatory protein